MNNVFSKTSYVWLAALSILPLSACSDMNEALSDSDSGRKAAVVFKIAGVPSNIPTDATESLGEVNVFHFKGEDFLMHTLIEDPYAEGIQLSSERTTRIYCVSGVDIDAGQGTERSRFAATTAVSPEGVTSAPLFYSTAVDFSGEDFLNGRIDVELKRSVARIDFINTEDTGFKVSQVIIENAPAASFVFESDSTVECGTVSYSREFAVPFYGAEEGLFMLFESQNPVDVRIIGEYRDSPLNIRTTLPVVERNKAYTLQMVNANSTVEGAFSIKDWEEGASVNASVSASGQFRIDRSNSIIPENVTVDYARNVLTVPHEGAADIKVAFLSREKVSVSSIDGEVPTVKITPNEAVQTGDGYISSLNISVQPNNRLSYELTVNLRDEAGRTDFLEILVLANPSRTFDTVEIAGRTWMAFNAVSSDPANQVFPVDGLSVEEMYQTSWPMAIGSFFQYGRVLAYSPWTRNDPAANDETPRDCPWATPEAMPVPPGYHVASAADWQSLMPNGTTFPSTYKAGNGEEIKAELITLPGTLNNSPSAAANKAGLLMRYLRFESQETGNVLIIPICGMKTPSMDEYPGGGRALHAWGGYWIYEDRCLWLFQVDDSAGTPTVTQGSSKWNYNGFMPVRGVKNAD